MDNIMKEIMRGENEELLECLRTGAKTGKSVGELARLVLNHLPQDNKNTVSVVLNFMNAFGLSLLHVKELPFAPCMGGGAYTDEEIDQLIRPHIQEHYLNKQGEASNERENK